MFDWDELDSRMSESYSYYLVGRSLIPISIREEWECPNPSRLNLYFFLIFKLHSDFDFDSSHESRDKNGLGPGHFWVRLWAGLEQSGFGLRYRPIYIFSRARVYPWLDLSLTQNLSPSLSPIT